MSEFKITAEWVENLRDRIADRDWVTLPAEPGPQMADAALHTLRPNESLELQDRDGSNIVLFPCRK